MKRVISNVEFITDLMESNPFNQMFIVDAILKHSSKIAETPLEELKEAFGPNALITPELWQETAKRIKTEMEKKYG